MRLLTFAGFSVVLCGCVAPRGAAKAQLTAGDLNVNARFGRMELAAESIAPEARQQFFEHRKTWGGKIRIADTELSNLQLKTPDDADITVRIAWYRVDDQELHTTTLRQAWHQYTEDWKLTGEARADGDIGLFGEAPPQEQVAPKRNAHFATVRIGAPPPETEQPGAASE
jgi:hypothetical protein